MTLSTLCSDESSLLNRHFQINFPLLKINEHKTKYKPKDAHKKENKDKHLPRLFELHKSREHAGDAGDLFLAIHVRRIGHVAFAVYCDAPLHERQQSEQVSFVSVHSKFLAQRLDEPGTVGRVAPRVVTCKIVLIVGLSTIECRKVPGIVEYAIKKSACVGMR